MTDSETFTFDESASRYEAHRGDQRIGLIDVVVSGRVATVTHTETDPALQGQGVAGRMTAYALDDLRARGLTVRPACPYTRSYIERHPEYADLLA